MAVKDIYDIAGHRTGFGNPDWLRTHPPATETAAAVQQLLDAGADMVGRTLTDELAYSLSGENIHYGTPVNTTCPDRVPGGSSSGSAAAVAARLVDFALGTDCGGSVRLPASYCGILGIRPTHGRVSLAGIAPFAASFDVAGWFARDADVFRRVGRVLLENRGEPARPQRLLIARDAFALVDSPVADAVRSAIDAVARLVPRVEEITVSPGGLKGWMEIFRVVQGSEIWANHGPWIESTKPRFGTAIAERLRLASRLDVGEIAARKPSMRRSSRTCRRCSARAISLSFRPRHASHRCAAPSSMSSKSSTATRRCACCASPGSAACRRSIFRWRRSTAARSGCRWWAAAAPTRCFWT